MTLKGQDSSSQSSRKTAPRVAIISTDPAQPIPRAVLKSIALLFDQFSVLTFAPPALGVEEDEIKVFLRVKRTREIRDIGPDIAWLRKQGVAVDGRQLFKMLDSPDDNATATERKDAAESRRKRIRGGIKITGVAGMFSRLMALRAASQLGWDATALGLDQSESRLLPVGASAALEVVLRAMPVPDEDTPWEAILEWRSDDEARSKLLRLRRWMHTLTASTDMRYLSDELDYLIDEYRRDMALHRISTAFGPLKTVVVTTADVLEGLVKFNWSSAAKALFAVSERKAALMQAEQNAPGREIAYIVYAREHFRERR